MAESEPKNVMPAVIGIALTCVFLLALGYIVQRRTAEERATPRLTIIAPAPNSVTDSPLVVRFSSTVPLELMTSGWGYGTMHLHASVNDTQLMPAAADIRKTGDLEYEWLMPGVHRIANAQVRLGWADAAHRPVPEGSSDPVAVDVR